MSGKSRRSSRAWVPMQRVQRIVPDKTLRAASSDPLVAKVVADGKEMWANNIYRVIVYRRSDGSVEHLSIARLDRRAARDWRHFQQMKLDIAGDVEAVELYPVRARTVDGANQFHLWCAPPGYVFPMGFDERMVLAPGDPMPAELDVTQRPFEEGLSL